MNITNNPNCQKNMVRKGGVTAICSLLTVALITMTFSTLALIRPVQAAVSKVAVVPTGKQSAKNMKDAALRSHFNPMPPDPAFAAALQQEEAQRRLGETCQRTGDFSAAAAAYTRAHAMIPDDTSVVYHLAECAEAMGDTEAALRYYRSVVYTDAPPPLMRTIQENDGPKLIPFVLLLNKTGQAQEAVSVYNYAIARIDFDPGSGKQAVDVLLPQFGDGPGQVPYTPQGLEAMAHLAITVTTNDMNIGRTNAQEAVGLAPDSALAHYYLGKCFYALGHNTDAKAELQQAVQLGDDQTVAAAKQILQFVQ
jgi:tetratricopeptide (TPR) repeat protein